MWDIIFDCTQEVQCPLNGSPRTRKNQIASAQWDRRSENNRDSRRTCVRARTHTHIQIRALHFQTLYSPALYLYTSDLRRSRKPQSAIRVSRGLARKQEEAVSLSPGGRNFVKTSGHALQFPLPKRIERNVACADGSPRKYKAARRWAQKKKKEKKTEGFHFAKLWLSFCYLRREKTPPLYFKLNIWITRLFLLFFLQFPSL